MTPEKSPGAPPSAASQPQASGGVYEKSLCAIAVVALGLAAFRVAIDTVRLGQDAARNVTDLTALALLGVAVIALVLLRVGPLTKLKLWDTEAEFGNAVQVVGNNTELALKDVITRLEEIRAAIGAREVTTVLEGVAAATVTNEKKDPPGLSRPRVRHDDPWKGRFGGQSRSGGYAIDASFKQQSADIVRVELVVTGPTQTTAGRTVEFFLHPTFRQDRVKVPIENGQARLDLAVWGGFTVGAWVIEDAVELELDLAEMPNAPAIIRER